MAQVIRIFQLFSCCSLALIACQQKQKDSLKIAAAANMQFAIKDLSKAFTDETGIEVDLIISSSGQLTAQIKSGAPYDVFISADTKYPADLFASGYATGEPGIYAYGKLVLWSMKDDIEPSIEMLSKQGIKHIAIANPKTAPYGIAAVEVLRRHGLYESLEDKLVFGESISQTNQFITSKSAEIGFTAKSVVLSPGMKGKGKWTDIDAADYSPIAQGVVVLKHRDSGANAMAFYNFLFSEKARTILKNFGYATNRNSL